MENELTVGRKDYATLKKIMVITGCMEKVCEIFEKYVLETEKVKKNLYISLGIYCNKSSFFDCTTAMAYFDLSKTVDKKRIVKSLLKQECDVQEICMYRRDFEKKEVCQPSTFNYKISKLMPHPYETDCINYWSDTKYFNYIVKDIQHIYSLESCQKLCIQIELIDRCNCQHVHLYTSLLNETYITDKDGTPLRTCSSIPSDKNADYKCYMNVQREHDEGVQTCDCKNPCLSVAYRMSVATSDWPSDYYMPIILEKLNESRIISPVDSLLRKRDYVRADVFFESLNVLSVKTNPKYNIDSFFAGLGGALSFYMGIAIIMVFEALELIFDILVTAMKELGQIERKEPK
ncbi:epithelial sodium channel subunit beta-like isoform X1 [Lepeophtheirus salmonis]|uniref:epithelial sodium channel subunit beta-like isoform X1 n=1 Tax=Lepeophtheirus salmonis TaxID=72036 RepID=UPI003AF337AD